jgi:co-chaperonin GroES (HSP10)
VNIKPFEDFICVRPMKVKDHTPSGIILPEKAKNMFNLITAEVVSVGPGRQLECGDRRAMDVKPGDRVIFRADVPFFPLADTGLWKSNGQKLPPMGVMNIGHLMGTLLDKDLELHYADEMPRIGEDD